ASASRVAALYRRHLGLARPGRLRPGAAVPAVALRSARLFSRRGPGVLVSGRPALSCPSRLVLVAAYSISVTGRRAEHGAVRRAPIFRPRALSVLRRNPPARRYVGHGRPGDCRRPHVGAGVDRVSSPTVRDRHPAAWIADSGLRIAD